MCVRARPHLAPKTIRFLPLVPLPRQVFRGVLDGSQVAPAEVASHNEEDWPIANLFEVPDPPAAGASSRSAYVEISMDIRAVSTMAPAELLPVSVVTAVIPLVNAAVRGRLSAALEVATSAAIDTGGVVSVQ